MSGGEGSEDKRSSKRWYDNDPVLGRALGQLRLASTKHQAQVALNIIKIIVEHQIEDETAQTVDSLEEALQYRRSWDDHRQHRRWYDVHETLSSAIQLLGDCPDDLQSKLVPPIVAMIERTLEEESA
jgi:hypothetical protein